MIEQERLGQLQSRLDKTTRAISGAQLIAENISPFLQADLVSKLGNGRVSSTEFLRLGTDTNRPAEIAQNIQDRTIPKLQSIQGELTHEISVFTSVSAAQRQFDQIEAQYKAGNASLPFYEQAQTALETVKRDAGIPPATQETVVTSPAATSTRRESTPKSEPTINQPEDTASNEADLPLLRIDLDNKRVEGQSSRVKGHVGWSVAMLFAMNPNQVITAAQIVERGKKAGSRENHAGSLVHDARMALGDHNLIKTIISRGRNTTYRMEAKVEFIPSRMVIDAEKRAIEFRGEKIQLTDFQFVLLDILAKNVDEQMVKSDLATIFEEGTSAARINNTFRALKRLLNMPDFPEVARNKKASVGSWYKLSGVNPVWKEIKDKPKRKINTRVGKPMVEKVPRVVAEQTKNVSEWEKFPVRDERLRALEWILDNPSGHPTEAIELLDYPGRRGRKQTKNSAWITLSRATEYLILRQREGIITDAELPVLDKLQRFFTKNQFNTADDFRKYLHDKFFPEDVVVATEDEIATDSVIEKAAVLATFFHTREDILRGLNVDTSYIENVARNLRDKLSHKGRNVEEIEEFRVQIFEELSVASKDNNLGQIFENSEDEDIQFLAIIIQDFMKNSSPEVISTLINGGQLKWQEKNADVLRVWQEWDFQGNAIIANPTEYKPKEPVEEGEQVDASDAVVGPEDDSAQTELASKAAFYETPSSNKTPITAIERRDPQVREKISIIVAEVVEKIQSELASLGQVSRGFNNLTRSDVSQYMNKNYVRRQMNRAPEFTKEEVALMVFVKRFGNGLNIRMIKDIRELISQEFTKQSS